MNSDIRVAVSFKGHRKRKKLHKMIGPQGVLCLLDLWLGVAMSNPAGMLTAWDEHDIALEAGWEGDPMEFVVALVDCRFLEKTADGTFKLHDWEDHQGYVVHAPARSERARLAAEARWNKRTGKEKQEHNADVMPVASGRQQQASKQHTEGNAPAPAPIPSPIPIPNPDPPPLGDIGEKRKAKVTDKFRPTWFDLKLWDAFLDNRKHKKLQNTELALKHVCECIGEALHQGFSLEDCVAEYVSGSWQKFNVQWMWNAIEKSGKRTKPMTLKEKQALELLGHVEPKDNQESCIDLEPFV